VKRGLGLTDEVEKRQLEVSTDREKKIIESIMWDCEMHYKNGPNMFSSMIEFYKFLDIEVRIHSRWDEVDFEKAKKAYTSWAKKSHSTEFDQLIMRFVNEISDGNKTFSRQELLTRFDPPPINVPALE